MHKHKQAGDTIIEVLIGIAIISAVLGGAFALANRSLVGARVSLERSEALKVAEGQIERLKYLARQSDEGTFNTTYRNSAINFCFGKTAPDHVKTDNPLPNYDDECVDRFYQVNITYLPISPALPGSVPFGTFFVNIIWDSLGSLNQESITINYQL